MPTLTINDWQPVTWENATGIDAGSAKDSIDVWRVEISSAASFIDLLTVGDHEKKTSYRTNLAQNSFVTARGALRYLLGQYLEKHPLLIKIANGIHGKPFLQNEGSGPLHFNISYSGEIVLIAIGGSELGIDTETLNPRFDYTGVLRRCFNETEMYLVQTADHPHEMFYRLWTRKEALIKSGGMGISDQLCRMPSIPGTYHIPDDWIILSDDCQITSFTTHDNAIAAIACSHSVRRFRFRHLVPGNR